MHFYINIIYNGGNEYKTPQSIIDSFLITPQIPRKICVWYLDPMGISINIRFFNKFPPKKILTKIRFRWWYFKMATEE